MSLKMMALIQAERANSTDAVSASSAQLRQGIFTDCLMTRLCQATVIFFVFLSSGKKVGQNYQGHFTYKQFASPGSLAMKARVPPPLPPVGVSIVTEGTGQTHRQKGLDNYIDLRTSWVDSFSFWNWCLS